MYPCVSLAFTLEELMGIFFSACDMSNARKANYQYKQTDFMVEKPGMNRLF